MQAGGPRKVVAKLQEGKSLTLTTATTEAD